MSENVDNQINNELLAVISAAIAFMNTKPGCKLEVKTIKRVPQVSPVWNTTGRLQRMARNLNA